MGNIAKIGRLLSDSLPIFLKRFYWTTHSLYSFLIVNVCCKGIKNEWFKRFCKRNKKRMKKKRFLDGKETEIGCMDV